MEIQRQQGPAQTGKLYLKRVDEPSTGQHLAEMAIEVADTWSAAPRLAPAVLTGMAGALGTGQLISSLSSDPWVNLGFTVAGGVAAAAVGGYFGPTVAQQAENLGKKLAPKIGMDSELGGVLMRTGFKVGTLAATYAVAPGVGGWLLGGEVFPLVNHGMKAARHVQEQRAEKLMEVQGGNIAAEPGHLLQVSDRGVPKSFLITRLYQE